MTIFGTAGNDHLSGTTGNDQFDLTQGGNDRVDGLDGIDSFLFGATLTAKDQIDGGVGNDSISLAGDYSSGLKFKANSLTSVEAMFVTPGNGYDFTLLNANTSGTFTLNAASLGAGDDLHFDGSRDTDTALGLFGGAGDDVLIGGGGHDTFTQSTGGTDVLRGNGNSDEFILYATFGAGDVVDGGTETDYLNLLGDYSAGLEITKDMMRDIEVMFLSGGFSYDLSLGAHVRGSQLYVNATTLESGDTASFDGSTVRDYLLVFGDGQGDDTFIGGAFGDTIRLTNGGDDHAEGRAGDDTFELGGAFNRNDHLDGGDGYDILKLGSQNNDVDFNAHTLRNVEEIDLAAGDVYVLIFDDRTVASGATLTVDGSLLGATESLSLEGQNETDGSYVGTGGDANDVLNGGAMDDTLTGGLGNDLFIGGLGADHLNGGMGADQFYFYTIEESSGPGHDVLGTFNATADHIGVTTAVTGVDPTIHGGTLSVATFDNDLSFAVDGNALDGGHAVIFRPDQGDLAGHIFLVIEFNGGAGYQAGQDWVMEIVSGSNLASLSTSSFLHIFP